MANKIPPSRRDFFQRCTGSMAMAFSPVLGWGRGPATRIMPLDRDWLFGGNFQPAAMARHFDDAAFSRITLPHCVTKLSWQNWDPAVWEQVWVYRRHFTLP